MIVTLSGRNKLKNIYMRKKETNIIVRKSSKDVKAKVTQIRPIFVANQHIQLRLHFGKTCSCFMLCQPAHQRSRIGFYEHLVYVWLGESDQRPPGLYQTGYIHNPTLMTKWYELLFRIDIRIFQCITCRYWPPWKHNIYYKPSLML